LVRLCRSAAARGGHGVAARLIDETGTAVGRITLNGIVRGALQSCSVGYWVGPHAKGRGLASTAVHDVVRIAFEELVLHRVPAETLLHNIASQRVLERNGFVRYGLAPQDLLIAGEWQDCLMYQVLRS
jgi:ribosomal-protein-alanine N-acetyltransferase